MAPEVTTETVQAPVTPAAGASAVVAIPEVIKPAKGWEPDWREKLAAKMGPGAKPAPSKAEAAPAAQTSTTQTTTGTAAAETPVANSDDELSTRLAEIARKNRIVVKREADLKVKEAQIRESTKADTELASKLRAASSSGKRVELLKAAGITEEQLRGPWIIDLLEELQQADEGGPPVSEARARQLMEQRAQNEEKARRERLQAQQTKQQQEAQQAEETAQATYYQGVGKLVKEGTFPLVAAVRPTYGDLDAEFRREFGKTGVRLTPTELLTRFEERYKKAGVTVAQSNTSARTTTTTPTQQTRSPRTVTNDMLNDNGGRPQELVTETRSYFDLTQEAKARVAQKFGNTWRKRGAS